MPDGYTILLIRDANRVAQPVRTYWIENAHHHANLVSFLRDGVHTIAGPGNPLPATVEGIAMDATVWAVSGAVEALAAKVDALADIVGAMAQGQAEAREATGKSEIQNWPDETTVTGAVVADLRDLGGAATEAKQDAANIALDTMLERLAEAAESQSTSDTKLGQILAAINAPALPDGAATAAGQGTLATSLAQVVARMNQPIPVEGTFYPSDQAVHGTVAVSNFPSAPTDQQIHGSVSVSNLPAVQPVSVEALPLPTGAATSAKQDTSNSSLAAIDTKLGATLAVQVGNQPSDPATGTAQAGMIAWLASIDGKAGLGLTDAQLRAAPLVVAPNALGLTDTQLRAAPVGVAGDFYPATQPVSGPLTNEQLRAAPLAVTPSVVGLTDAQLRSSAVPISATTLPLPAGAAADGTDITGATMPTGGVGLRGWLSAIFTQFVARVPILTLVSGALKVDGSAVTQPVSIAGTVSTKLVPQATGGLTTKKIIAAAGTNGQNVKATAGTLFGGFATNRSLTTVWVKFFAKATAPTVGTDTPILTFGIPAGQSIPLDLSTHGTAFAGGIGVAITGGYADLDATVVIAGDLVLNFWYA